MTTFNILESIATAKGAKVSAHGDKKIAEFDCSGSAFTFWTDAERVNGRCPLVKKGQKFFIAFK